MCSRGYKLPSQVDPVGNYDFVVLYYCVPCYQHSLPGHVVGSLGNCWKLRCLSIFGRWKCCSNLSPIGCVFRGWSCWRKLCSSRICLFGGRRSSSKFYSTRICVFRGWNYCPKLYSTSICLFGSWGFCIKLNSSGLFFSSTFSYPKPILASWNLDINHISINHNFSSYRTINNHSCSGPRIHEHRSTIWSR